MRRSQCLSRLYLENIGEERILRELGSLFGYFAKGREMNEHFGDFVIHTGIVRGVFAGKDSND
ncbi:MAG: hypothetical protein ABI351_14405 [Herbaspirillum sp.]